MHFVLALLFTKGFFMKTKTNTELLTGIRRDWNGVNPRTKVIPDKKRYNRGKAKSSTRKEQY